VEYSLVDPEKEESYIVLRAGTTLAGSLGGGDPVDISAVTRGSFVFRYVPPIPSIHYSNNSLI
jgi:hypothetical protein